MLCVSLQFLWGFGRGGLSLRLETVEWVGEGSEVVEGAEGGEGAETCEFSMLFSSRFSLAKGVPFCCFERFDTFGDFEVFAVLGSFDALLMVFGLCCFLSVAIGQL